MRYHTWQMLYPSLRIRYYWMLNVTDVILFTRLEHVRFIILLFTELCERDTDKYDSMHQSFTSKVINHCRFGKEKKTDAISFTFGDFSMDWRWVLRVIVVRHLPKEDTNLTLSGVLKISKRTSEVVNVGDKVIDILTFRRTTRRDLILFFKVHTLWSFISVGDRECFRKGSVKVLVSNRYGWCRGILGK